MKLNSSKKSTVVFCVLLVLVVYCVEGTESDVDEFIVDDDKKDETVKKSMLLSSGSMALGFMPKKTQPSAVEKLIVAANSGRHLEPSINLEKSLKTLDVSGDKRGILPKPPAAVKQRNNTNTTAMEVDTLKLGILKGLKAIKYGGEEGNSTTGVKKNATPNVITNSTILGYLSKDPKFSIGDVGNQKEDNGVGEKNEGEEKRSRNTNDETTKKNSTIAAPGTRVTSGNSTTDNETQQSSKKTKTKLHLVNAAAFLMPPSEPTLIDHGKLQENAVKKGVKLSPRYWKPFILQSLLI